MLNYGPERFVGPAVLRMPEPCMWSMYAKITFWRQTSQRLKGNDWTEGQYRVAQTQLHKSQHHSFLIPHSQIWIRYPHFYLPRRTFISSHPVSGSRGCDSVWSSIPPEVHPEPFPQIWCAVWVWAHSQPAFCHCKVGTHFKCVQMG